MSRRGNDVFRYPELRKMVEHLGNFLRKASWSSVSGIVGGDESLPEVGLYGPCK